ncbi:hypothetical protein [Gorillibacterium sp. sgz5001074]|uniref:hypothetical protein n=1 Tax=Gorillibacterium sp. sgz5001074 TaxID=3446695 RepID=UPI003F680313
MHKKLLDQIILFDENEELTQYWFERYQNISLQGPLLYLVKDQVTNCFLVTRTPDGITELVNSQGERFRISGISYSEGPNASLLSKMKKGIIERDLSRFLVADSYERPIDLFKFV